MGEQYELDIIDKKLERKVKLKKYAEARQKKREYRREYEKRPEVKKKKNKAKNAKRKRIRTVNSLKDITLQWASLRRTRLIVDTRKRNLNNVTVELTPKDILDLIPKDLKCPVYKVPFVFNTNSPWNLSFDRIDNNKSYTKDNVVVVSVKVNTIKNTATSKELYKIADFYYELEKKQLDK